MLYLNRIYRLPFWFEDQGIPTHIHSWMACRQNTSLSFSSWFLLLLVHLFSYLFQVQASWSQNITQDLEQQAGKEVCYGKSTPHHISVAAGNKNSKKKKMVLTLGRICYGKTGVQGLYLAQTMLLIHKTTISILVLHGNENA